MKLYDFINKYKSKSTYSEKQRMLSGTIKRYYVPIMEKQVIANQIKELSNCNVLTRYILTCLSLIVLYSEIDIDLTDYKIEDFDLLNENRVFDAIVNIIDKNEINEYNMIIEMEFNK